LIDNRSTVAVAERCTGGLVAERLTRIPGSSNYFLGGAVCYSNEMKSAWADVPAELIAARGAVSSEVAIALAEGIRKRVRSTLGIGVTGIAGPGGGSEEKPVGTVHVALASPSGSKGRLVHLPGDREAIRFYASQIALDVVRMHFLFQSPAAQNRKTNP
jgi:nicotinamide-nucleotide amidase